MSNGSRFKRFGFKTESRCERRLSGAVRRVDLTEFGAKTMALDPKTHNILVSMSDFDQPATPTERQPNPLERAKQGNFRVLVYAK
jgi:hypothetical protein